MRPVLHALKSRCAVSRSEECVDAMRPAKARAFAYLAQQFLGLGQPRRLGFEFLQILGRDHGDRAALKLN